MARVRSKRGLGSTFKEMRMAFADWKKRSKLFQNTRARNRPDQIDSVCEAAYKAGERDGKKQAEEAAERAIELKKLMNQMTYPRVYY